MRPIRCVADNGCMMNFQQTLQDFDRTLQSGCLAHLSLEEAAHILDQVELFHLEARCYQELVEMGELPASAETEYLIAAGCRLASDLSEKVMLRIVDVLDSRQHSLDFLYQELRKKLRDKHQASCLLQKAQEIRQLTHETGETCGLGMVL